MSNKPNIILCKRKRNSTTTATTTMSTCKMFRSLAILMMSTSTGTSYFSSKDNNIQTILMAHAFAPVSVPAAFVSSSSYPNRRNGRRTSLDGGAGGKSNHNTVLSSFSLSSDIIDNSNRRNSISKRRSASLSKELDSITSNTKQFHSRRLTIEQEKSLLRDVMELRRLKEIENQFQQKNNLSTINNENKSCEETNHSVLLERAKISGYGTDVQEYTKAYERGIKAREALVTSHMGLVYFCVNDILGSKSGNVQQKTASSSSLQQRRRLNSLSREDLIQEGAIGLAKTVDKYDPNIGGRFSTYAVYWIRAAILRCIADKDDVMRVPEYVSQSISKVNKAAKLLGYNLNDYFYDDDETNHNVADDAELIVNNKMKRRNSRAATVTDNNKYDTMLKELAKVSGLTEKQVLVALEVRNRRNKGGYVPYEEEWMLNSNEDIIGDENDIVLLTDNNNSHNSDKSHYSNTNFEHLRKTLSPFLRPKEMEALCWRYGLISSTSISTAAKKPPKSTKTSLKRKSIQGRRDYLAEAEMELFGSVTTDPFESVPDPAFMETRAAARTTPAMTTRGKWGEAMSFKEVGQRMQVSAEYGRRLCHAAIEKLKQAADDGKIEPALLLS